jgi:hypothetical protein
MVSPVSFVVLMNSMVVGKFNNSLTARCTLLSKRMRPALLKYLTSVPYDYISFPL